MNRFVLICTILSFFTIAHGQETDKVIYNEGMQYLRSGKAIEAQKKFTEALQITENVEVRKRCLIFRGKAYYAQYKYDSAIIDFTEAIKLDPNDAASYTDRALAYMYNKNFTSAITDFNKVLSMNRKDSQAEAAYYWLGRIKFSQGDMEKSIAYYDSLLILVPSDAEAYYLRGVAKGNMMNIEGSIKDYDMAIKYKPNYMEALANRGIQKINALPVSEKTGKKDCLEEPCADLLKAKELGDKTVGDMIWLYCKKCK